MHSIYLSKVFYRYIFSATLFSVILNFFFHKIKKETHHMALMYVYKTFWVNSSSYETYKFTLKRMKQ